MRRYHDFYFPDGGCRHLEFSKIRNFNGLSTVGGQYASSCQISSKSVERLQRYGDLTVFKMAAVRHLGFVKFDFLTVRAVNRPFCTSVSNFVKIGQTVADISRFFLISIMSAAAILNFQKFKILTAYPLQRANMRHHANFNQNRSNGCRDMAI